MNKKNNGLEVVIEEGKGHQNPANTTTKEGYIAIQISSQTTKKKVSENP
jgi:hypothetical protein